MIDIEQLPDRLRISYYDKTGQVSLKDIAIPKAEKFVWDLAGTGRADSKYTTWNDKPVKKKGSFFLNKFRIEEFMMSLPEYITEEVYEFNQPEVWFCDIEVEVKDSFPDPEQAATPVTTIALVNPSKNEVHVLGLKELSGQEVNLIANKTNEYFKKFNINFTLQYTKFESEAEMLMTLMEHYIKKIPLLTGWNFIGFDWKYIINRCKRVGVDPSKCSINGTLNGRDEIPTHKVIVDYLELYKKWDRVVKIKENNKLDTVAFQVLGLQKIKYSGTLMDLYNTDFLTYVYYNIVDTILVHLIDQKIKTMQTFLMLGNITKVEALKAFSPIWMTEIVMAREFFSKNKVVAEKNNATKTNGFEGAYVKKPEVGLHEYLAIFDFASLYPSTMRQWNISPEMYRGKNIELIDGWIKTASGAVFDNRTDSVMRTILENFYAQRKVAKKKSFDIEKEIFYLEKIYKTK